MALGAVIPIALAADTISITIMEIVDNAIMLLIPGAMDAGLGDIGFWARARRRAADRRRRGVPGEPLADQPRARATRSCTSTTRIEPAGARSSPHTTMTGRGGRQPLTIIASGAPAAIGCAPIESKAATRSPLSLPMAEVPIAMSDANENAPEKNGVTALPVAELRSAAGANAAAPPGRRSCA